MDAKKIENIGWDEKKRFDLPSLPEFGELFVKRLHDVRSLMSRNRVKTDNLCAIRLNFCNLIISRFPLASLSGKELKKVSMELQHDAGGERDVSMVSVNRIEDIPVTGNFLLRAIQRVRLLGNQVPNTLQNLKIELRSELAGANGPVTLEDGPITTDMSMGPTQRGVTGNGQPMPCKDRSYRSMFYQGRTKALDRGGFQDNSEFFNVIKSQRYDPRLQELQECLHL